MYLEGPYTWYLMNLSFHFLAVLFLFFSASSLAIEKQSYNQQLLMKLRYVKIMTSVVSLKTP